MEDALVSVIVPVYNSATHLGRCIKSLINQSYRNLEFIFVDDGSEDYSRDILMDAQSRDSRITVLFQKNAGPSAARNAGLDIAKGKYIMFCDSDDTVAVNWCQRMVSVIQKHPDAFIVCGFFRLDESGVIVREHRIDEGIYRKDQYFLLYLPGLSGSACNKIYQRSTIQEHGLKFDSFQRYAEDAIFNLQYLELTNSIVVVGDCLYNYYLYTTFETLSSKVSYFQLRDVYHKRLNYIAPEYIGEFKYSFWLNAWSKFQEELNNKSNSWLVRIKNAQAIARDAVFRELFAQYGENALDKKSLILLKCRLVSFYCIMQSLSNGKRFLKQKFLSLIKM